MKEILLVTLTIILSLNAQALFEVKDASNHSVFEITDDGIRIFNYPDTLMIISADEIRANLDNSTKGLSRSFSISTNATGKAGSTNVLEVKTDQTTMRENSLGEKYTDFSPHNLFLGLNAGSSNSGYDNVFFGNQAGSSNLGGSNNIFVGADAGMDNETGYNNLFIGSNAGKYNDSGDNNIFLGNQAGHNNAGSSNIFVGLWSGQNNQEGYNNIFLGEYSGLYNSSGFSNVFIGLRSGRTNSSGFNNIFLGEESGNNNTTGYSNVFIGLRSGFSSLSGDRNVFIGEEAGFSCESGLNNVFLGESAGRAIQGAYGNVFIGQSAGKILLTGDMNTYIGYNAGSGYAGGTDFDGNVYIGANAGASSEGSHNIFLGYNAGYYETGSYKLYIDNITTSNPLIYGEFDNDFLRINGDLEVTGNVGVGTTSNTDYGINVLGNSRGVNGVASTTTDSYTSGVYGTATGGSVSNYGVRGYASGSSNTNCGIYGYASDGITNYAGYFSGNINVTGTVLKSADQIKIDHPLQPESKFLSYSTVVSDKMMGIYNGIAILNGEGEAIVTMPDWFESANTEFRYQLTAIGAPGPNLYILKKISGNTFEIAGGEANMEVSWQVTGIRNDNFARKHPIEVETAKNLTEKGYYLHPESYGLPKEKGIEYQHEQKMIKESKK